MALSDDDKKEVEGLITGALGLEDGQSLSDAIKAAASAQVNGLDKRLAKELPANVQKALGIELEEGQTFGDYLKKALGDPDSDPDKDPADSKDPDLSKLPPEIR